MSEFDQWEIAGVLPGDYEDYGDWVFQKAYHGMAISSGLIYHKHLVPNVIDHTNRVTLFMVGSNKCCRKCSAPVPLGILFRAKTSKFDSLGVE